MSMTREEATKILRKRQRYCKVISDHASVTVKTNGLQEIEAIDMALSALRPVSREQVEQIKGVWIFNDDWWEFRCSECHKGIGNIEKFKFCPACGAPMTDEAVKMVMDRLEVLKDG